MYSSAIVQRQYALWGGHTGMQSLQPVILCPADGIDACLRAHEPTHSRYTLED